MSTFHYRWLTGFVFAFSLLAQLQAQTRKGNQFLAEGKLHEARKEWDAAIESYGKALAEDPASSLYQLTLAKARVLGSQAHIDKGIKVRSAGDLAAALAEFQQAASIDPGSGIARQELDEIRQMIERERLRREETGKEAPPQVRALTPGQTAEQAEADKVARMRAVPELHPTIPGRVSLKLTAKTKVAFETVCKSAGLSILWDPDFIAPANDMLAVNFTNATPDEVLDYVARMSKSTWKRLSPNTIYVSNQ